ncbi:MAG: Uma2 family endonuclease [Acidimicrobiales bacterium]
MAVQRARHRFSVDDYYRMAESGVLGPGDRVELIEGEIVEMSPIGSRHAACLRRLVALFSEGTRGRAILSVQDPVRLDQHSEPQPDLALLRPRPDYYADGHPGPGDVLLLVEVCDTTWAFDQG